MKSIFRAKLRRVVFAVIGLSGTLICNAHAAADFTGKSNWFLGVGGGGSGISLPGQTKVENGAAAPYDYDAFTIKNASANFMQIDAGYRFFYDRKYFPYSQLYLEYRHYIRSKIRGTIDQYSLPGYENYSYKVNYGADLFTLNDKFNLFSYNGWLPYFSLGAGMIINHLYDYREYPLGVTPRTNPDFGGSTSTKFAVTLGLGIDYMLTENVWATLGYDHIFQGDIKTNAGTSDWSSQKLYIGNAKMDSVFINFTANIPDAIRGSA